MVLCIAAGRSLHLKRREMTGYVRKSDALQREAFLDAKHPLGWPRNALKIRTFFHKQSATKQR